MPELTLDEVKTRLSSYSDNQVTDELYTFGEALVSDAVDRIAKLDSKASALAAYSGGIVTILISTSGLWGKLLHGCFFVAAVLGIVAMMLAAWLAIRSIYPQATEWYTTNGWLESDCIQSHERLRRYRILAMWKILSSHFAAIRIKNSRLKIAVYTIHVAFGFLFLSFLEIAWGIAPYQNLRVWVW